MNHVISKRLISIAFILITFMLVLNIFLTYRNSREIKKNRILQQQTEEIKETLSNVAIVIIHNLDLGIRSYALFNDDKYLYPFYLALKEKDSLLNNIETLLSQQGYPLTEFYQLKDSINTYSSLNSKLKILFDTKHLDEFQYLADQDKGYRLWLQYEQFAKHVMTFENDIRAQATRNYENALRNNYLIQFFLFLICVPTLLFTTLHINKTFALESKLKAAETDRANLLLMQNELLEKKF